MIVYLVIINAISLLLMSADKLFAINRSPRIPESTLLLSAILGGSIGCLAGMILCRHKTQHRQFFIGLPVIACLQGIVLLSFFHFA